jgi:hypothetical protein
MIYAYLALSTLLVAALAARLAWPRLVQTHGRVSVGDRAAIELFLANRDETATMIEKEFWRGGPEGRLGDANIHGVPRGGRFYRVLAADVDGRAYRHALVAAGDQARRNVTVFQQGSEGVWSKVLQ